MDLFYEPALSHNKTEILLNEQESRHALKVLRHKAGDPVMLTNGKGYFFEAVILSDTQKQCWLQITGSKAAEAITPYRHLITAPIKNRNRMEWLMEKATELGVTAISVVHTRHTERTRVNQDRVERLLISAMKQSMRATLPSYTAYSSLQACFDDLASTSAQRLIAECEIADKPHLTHAYNPGQPAHLLFGPEGDFAGEELNQARAASFQPVSLGNLRMRAETAPLAGLAMLEALDVRHRSGQ